MDVPTLPRSWWTKHPEAAEFVRGLFGTMRIAEMPAAIAAKFGPDIAPKKSAVARYMSYLRGGPGLGQKPSRARAKSRSKPQIRARARNVSRDAAKAREAAEIPD
jgi:hypothetical protein